MTRRLGLAAPLDLESPAFDVFRKQLVRLGSLVLAAIEAEDRRRQQQALREQQAEKKAGEYQSGSGF